MSPVRRSGPRSTWSRYGPVTPGPGNSMEAETAQDSAGAARAARGRRARSSTVSCATCARSTASSKALATGAPAASRCCTTSAARSSELGEIGGATLFWGERTPAGGARSTCAAPAAASKLFEQRVGDIEGRRQALLEEIQRSRNSRPYVLEDDLFEAQEEEERRKLEWIVEREIGSCASRALIMPWTRGGEDDRRFRKTLATALLICLLLRTDPAVDRSAVAAARRRGRGPAGARRAHDDGRCRRRPCRPVEPVTPTPQERARRAEARREGRCRRKPQVEKIETARRSNPRSRRAEGHPRLPREARRAQGDAGRRAARSRGARSTTPTSIPRRAPSARC